jgi:hypothetical protein
MADATPLDRRRFRRVSAPILMRPAGLLARLATRKVNDISLGGIRTFSDLDLPKGRRLDVELLFQDGSTANVLVEVAWTERLAPGAPAPFEMGLRLVDARAEDLERIALAMQEPTRSPTG